MYERSLHMCTRVYGERFLRDMADAMDAAEHPSQVELPIDMSDVYPRFVHSQLE